MVVSVYKEKSSDEFVDIFLIDINLEIEMFADIIIMKFIKFDKSMIEKPLIISLEF